MRIHLAGLALVPMVALLACTDRCPLAPPTPQPPASLAGRYVLVTANGGPLPMVLSVIPPEVYRLVSQTVWLRADSTYADTAVTETDARPFGPLVTDTFALAGRWRADTMPIVHDTMTRLINRGPIGLPEVVLRFVRVQ